MTEELNIKLQEQLKKVETENKISVALDVDGVLANFYLAMCRKYDMPFESVNFFGVKWIEEKLKETDGDFEFWENLPLLNVPEAISFDFDYYITSIPVHLIDSRKKWLLKNGFPDKPIFVTNNKAQLCKDLGVKVLIDDRPSTIIDCMNNGILGIQYIPYYSNMKVMTQHYVTHLYDIKYILKNVKF